MVTFLASRLDFNFRHKPTQHDFINLTEVNAKFTTIPNKIAKSLFTFLIEKIIPIKLRSFESLWT